MDAEELLEENLSQGGRMMEPVARMQAARVARLDMEASRQEAGMDREAARQKTVLLSSHDGTIVS